MNLHEIERRLTRAIGLEPLSLGDSVLRRAVEHRMQTARCETLGDYTRILDRDPAELRRLIEDIVVGESWFLRHPQAFQTLASHALMVARSQEGRGRPYRVLSLPCAAGEEPYSIVLTLLDAGLPPDRIQVDAADVSDALLAKARAGVYRERALRGLGSSLRDRAFRHAADGYAIRTEIAGCVTFHHSNILDDPSPALSGPYDAVFCRNLLIYLTAPARARACARLDRSLSPGGLLFLGHAEHPDGLEDRYERLGAAGSFAFRRLTDAPHAPEVKRSHAAAMPRPRSQADPKRASPRAQASPSAAPAAKSVKNSPPKPSADRATRSDMLQEARRLANDRRHDDALAACEQLLARQGPSAEVYQLMGMIHQAMGRWEKARRELQRAIYLDPDSEESLLALALLSAREGDEAAARRFRARARRAGQKTSRAGESASEAASP